LGIGLKNKRLLLQASYNMHHSFGKCIKQNKLIIESSSQPDIVACALILQIGERWLAFKIQLVMKYKCVI
jgi:hypothetical protein